ncbi:hypothetical protein JCGZ_14967 [Jatropha curcas]|uniref:t-SNARE coiled-coil homology domain-containing protein n=2 Tax=Jatropha curcas TaxID=180498 RepID=A0A067K5Z7_JATCU|nr:hypothetical protein JCGZ_14967 [Jatropha curcas]
MILRGLRDRMESDILSVLKKAKVVKSRLESLDKSKDLYKEGSSVYRTRMTVTNGLKVKLTEMLNQFQFLREKILSDYKDDIRRKYYAETGEEASEEVIENMVFGGEMFKERHEAVMELQRSLTKLHQVFLDMAVIVETQGEKIDDIEENVVNAGSFISGGTNSLYYANQMRQKTKPWVYWVWVVILIVLLVCIVSMFVS